MHTTRKAGATYQNVLDAPQGQIAEIIDGSLYVSPRRANPATIVTANLATELLPPFHRGRGGPGGWIIMFEPELHISNIWADLPVTANEPTASYGG